MGRANTTLSSRVLYIVSLQEHRVRLIKNSKLRQSLAFFIAPDGETVVEGLVKPKEGWTFTDSYPRPANQTFHEYHQERIKRAFGTNYYG